MNAALEESLAPLQSVEVMSPLRGPLTSLSQNPGNLSISAADSPPIDCWRREPFRSVSIPAVLAASSFPLVHSEISEGTGHTLCIQPHIL